MAKTKLSKRQKKVAIFDIDGTIFRSSLLVELTDAFIQAGIFPARTSQMFEESRKKWLDRNGSYEDYIEAVIRAFRRNIQGVRYKDFAKIAKKVIDFHGNRTYRYTRDLVKQLKNKQYYLLAISHSPQKIVKEFCIRIGFDKVYGQLYELDNHNKFTGEILHLDLILDKSKILQRAIDKENLTLKHSVGVGDTESDISFLKKVARPICFNPNKKLYNYAKRKRWPVVVERKDVIYHF